MGMRRWLPVLNATSIPSKTSIVSMRGTLVVFLLRFESAKVSAKCFRGLHILSISQGILIFLAFSDEIGSADSGPCVAFITVSHLLIPITLDNS